MIRYRLQRAPRLITWRSRDSVELLVGASDGAVFTLQIDVDLLGSATCKRAAKNKSGRSRVLRGGIIAKRVDKTGG